MAESEMFSISLSVDGRIKLANYLQLIDATHTFYEAIEECLAQNHMFDIIIMIVLMAQWLEHCAPNCQSAGLDYCFRDGKVLLCKACCSAKLLHKPCPLINNGRKLIESETGEKLWRGRHCDIDVKTGCHAFTREEEDICVVIPLVQFGLQGPVCHLLPLAPGSSQRSRSKAVVTGAWSLCRLSIALHTVRVKSWTIQIEG
ncbi:hypothetical protein LSH36_730g00021 [Paralvinella palmiformis]|uniref:Uncharacterized protein n=1 Tax=Paralvinella palmiformis TaxID=53620 RepID=A0AAD9MTF5_9ANNE|nr:hypothetical protein LSH36_730g00021 [Paralvinella palmiformis]